MLVYGVYKGDIEGSYLQGKAFKDLSKAVEYAKELVKKEDKYIDRMIKFCREQKELKIDYHYFNKVSNYCWKGGYMHQDEIFIKTLELVE